MSDDTRDIAIQTRADVKHLSDQVGILVEAVSDLKADLAERKGAEKLARALHTMFGGAVGAVIAKAITWAGGWPLK